MKNVRTKNYLKRAWTMWAIGWFIMIVPVCIYLCFNFDVFTPAKISGIFMLTCFVIGMSMIFKIKDVGGIWCLVIGIFMMVMRNEGFYVMAWALLLFGACNLLASLVFFKLAKYYKERFLWTNNQRPTP